MEQYGIGIDLGGTSAKCALLSESGQIFATGIVNTPADEQPVVILDALEKEIKRLCEIAAKKGYKSMVVGMGTPGSVDIERGFLKGSTPNFKYWRNVPIADELQKRIGLPVFVDNDANLMSLGEFQFGAGKEYQNIICLTVGTGIGGAIIINGNLYRGSEFAGGELGHVTINTEGRACKCGGKGCLEQYASATAMLRNYKQISASNGVDDVKQLFELQAAEDKFARETIENAAYSLGRGIANFINIFNPEAVVVGGGVAEAGEIYLQKVRETALQFAMQESSVDVKIIGATLGNKAGFMGAIHFAFGMLDIKR